MPSKTLHQPQPSQTYSRIRAFRQHDVDSQIERSRLFLGLGSEFAALDAKRTHRLARALRQARRAARSGSHDYDPVRHLLLVRYLHSLRLPQLCKAENIRKKRRIAREDV